MASPFHSLPRSAEWTGPTPEQEFYQKRTTEEDKERTNVHYEQPVEFFYAITGGEWNVYSCNLFDQTTDDTAAQEAKLDMMARLMDLRPGQRILDVGCGWGGPLTYLCTHYGVSGVGLTLSPTQKAAAQQRVARYGADVAIVESHWRDFEDAHGFDAVYTDEVIVHFEDLDGFFAKACRLLHAGGHFVNKELHFTSSHYKQLGRGDVFLNEIYGLTGNYRTLAEELSLLDTNGFELLNIHTIDRSQYRIQAEHWQANMYAHRERLIDLVGDDYYRRFRTYLKLVGKLFRGHQMSVDIVASQKLA